MLAESGAGGGAGAPHEWLTVPYHGIHLPAPVCGVEVAFLYTGVPVHGAAAVLPLSEAVVTQVLWPLLCGLPIGAQGEGPRMP